MIKGGNIVKGDGGTTQSTPGIEISVTETAMNGEMQKNLQHEGINQIDMRGKEVKKAVDFPHKLTYKLVVPWTELGKTR